MLPTLTPPLGYYANPPRKRRRNDESPWGLLLLLSLAAGCALVTRHLSLLHSEAATSDSPGLLDPSSTAPSISDLTRYAAYNFTPTIHKMYQNMAPLHPITHAQAKGGWKYSELVYDYAANHPAAEVISWDAPRVVHFRSFMTPDEVDQLIGVSKGHLERSSVLSADEEENRIDDVRTSFGTWPPVDDFISGIEERIHRLVGIPKSFGEQIYVLNYKINEKYDAHNDNCMDDLLKTRRADDTCNTFLRRSGGPGCGAEHGGDSCGDRIATLILVLKAPKRGGRTVFPSAALTKQRMEARGASAINMMGDAWYCQNDEVLGVTANPGDAILFYDYKPAGGDGTGSYADGTAQPAAIPVPESMHSGCPVLEGEKWIATRWIRAAAFI